jgi:O-antigen/teichoic acid export membrane protein
MTQYFSSLFRGLSPNIRKIFANATWLFFDRILRMASSIFIGAWVARYLGVENFGLYNYAIAFVGIFATVATLGLDQIVIRDTVRHPLASNQILGTAFVMKLVGGTIALISATLTLMIVRSGDGLALWLVAIIASSLIFQAFDVIDFWFQSQVQSKHTVLAKNLAFISTSIGKILLIQAQAPLILFAWIYAAEFAFGALGLAMIYQAQGGRLKKWLFTLPWAKRLLKDSWTLILSGFFISIYMRIDQIMLGQISGDSAVGIYSVAVKISELWYFVPVAIANSVYPAIVEAKQISEERYYERLQKTLDLLTFLSYSIAIGFSIASGWIIQLLFGAEYTAATSVLIVHIWTGVFVSSGLIRSLWTTTEGMMQYAFVTSTIGAIINIGLNFAFIPRYGGVGAAIATVISQIFAAYLTSVFFQRTRKFFWLQTKSLLFPNPFSILKATP